MKKAISILLVNGVILMSLLFSGCASNTEKIIDINVAEENDTSEIISENEAPNNTTEADVAAKMKDAAALCFENIIEEAEVMEKIEELIINETQFILKMDTEWPDENAEEIEYNGGLYLLVGEFLWSEYESMARHYYSDNYIASVFTPWYFKCTQTFLELDGKLYRAEADGIGIPVKEDSIDIWEIAEGLYYVTVLLDTDDQTTVRVYIVQEDSDKEYGFIILNKYSAQSGIENVRMNTENLTDNVESLDEAKECILPNDFFNVEGSGKTAFANLCLSSFYNSPKDVDLEELFYNGFGLEINDSDRKFLEKQNAELDYDVIKLPKSEMDKIMLKYFGISLSESNWNGIEKFYYNQETDTYYLIHNDFHQWQIEIWDQCIDEMGNINVVYSKKDDERKCITIIKKEDENYIFLSNQLIN